jgi:flagellar hook assembly protein FlgD
MSGNSSTTIKFSIVEDANFASPTTKVTLKVYDILGTEIATLVNENLSAGEYEVKFDGNGLSTGIYFYRLQIGNFTETKKMLFLK